MYHRFFGRKLTHQYDVGCDQPGVLVAPRWWRSGPKVWTNHLSVEEDTMWTRMMCVRSLASTVWSSFAFAGDFEGVIHMKSTFAGDETKVSESDWFIKGDHLRMERRSKNSDQSDSGRMGVMIFNPERN